MTRLNVELVIVFMLLACGAASARSVPVDSLSDEQGIQSVGEDEDALGFGDFIEHFNNIKATKESIAKSASEAEDLVAGLSPQERKSLGKYVAGTCAAYTWKTANDEGHHFSLITQGGFRAFWNTSDYCLTSRKAEQGDSRYVLGPNPGEDIDGDGVPDLLIYYGSSECRSEVVHLTCGDPAQVRAVIYGRYSEPTYRDFDSDGRMEVSLGDSAYVGWNADPTNSPMPCVIFRIRNCNYEMDGDLMRSFGPTKESLVEEAERLRKEVETLCRLSERHRQGYPVPMNNPLWDRAQEGVWRNSAGVVIPPEVWGMMLDLLYSGRCEEVRIFAEAVWPVGRPGLQEFISDVASKVLVSWFGTRLPWVSDVKQLRDEANRVHWDSQYKARSLAIGIRSGSMIHSFSDSEWQYRADWSRDGRYLAVVYKNRGDALRWGVVDVRDIEKTGNAFDKVRPLDISEADTSSVTWHPNGKTLLFSYHIDGRWRLLEYNLQNDHKRFLDIPGSVGSPSYSPDGERLAYSTQWLNPVSQEEEWRVHIRDLKTGGERELSEQAGFDATTPKWSPDGSRIVYERAYTNHVELEMLDVETGRRAPAWIPPNERYTGSQSSAAWSGDGRYLAFFVECGEGDTLNGNHLIVVDVREGTWTDLSDQEEGDCLYDGLAWNPTKDWLYCNGLDGFHTLAIRTPQAIDSVPVLGRLAKWLSLDLPDESRTSVFQHGLLLGVLLAACLGLIYRIKKWALRLAVAAGSFARIAVRRASFRRPGLAKAGLMVSAAVALLAAGWGVWASVTQHKEGLSADTRKSLPHPLMTEFDIASSELPVLMEREGSEAACARTVQRCYLEADEIGTEMAMVFHAHEEGDAATDVATPAKEAAERLVALRAELKKVHCPIDCRGLVNAMETVLKEAERFYRQWARMGTFSAERQKRSQRAYEAYLSTADRYYFDPVCLEDEVSAIFTNDCVALAVAANDWGATLNAADTPSAGGSEALPDSSFYSDDYPFISGLWRVLNGQGYSPFLASAFLCWRRDVQNEQYGFYEWANIPNREYNVIRFRALDRVEAYLQSNPGDVHAQAQRDVLLYTPNIGRAGNKGEALRPDVIGRADGCL